VNNSVETLIDYQNETTTTSENAYSRFFYYPCFLAANSFYINPVQVPKTYSNSIKYASVPTVAGDNPVNEWDPSGMCVSLFGVVCVGSGSVTSTVTFRLNSNGPQEGLNWFNQNINPVYGLIDSVYNYDNCYGSVYNCLNENFNPAFSLLMNGRNAWDGWSNPCVSGWTETGYILQTGESGAATVALAYGLEQLGAAGLSKFGSSAPEEAMSTGRTVPTYLKEQLAMESAQADPTAGLKLGVDMTDPRWPASQGWVKMAQNISGVEIHYVYNADTGASADFKFVP
jgi:hypothetical protein